MLGPVAKHHNKPAIDHRDDQDHNRGFEIDKAHEDTEQNVCDFACAQPHVKLLPFTFEEIVKGFHETGDKKTEEVFHEICKTVAPVMKCAAGIIFLVVFYMVHPDVVGKISLRSMSEKRAYKPCSPLMHPFITFFENAPVAHAVKGQAKASFEIRL